MNQGHRRVRKLMYEHAVGFVQIADYGGLLGDGWEGLLHVAYKVPVRTRHYSPEGRSVDNFYDRLGPQNVLQVAWQKIIAVSPKH